MCGRYFFQDNINLKKYHDLLKRKWEQPTLDLWKTGEIFPGNIVLALADEQVELMKWGYDLYNRQMINSRIESIERFYRDEFAKNKCVVVANGFYEWNQSKDKYYITSDSPLIFLAALYQQKESFDQFSIITKQANDTSYIHHRVPIVLNENEAIQYMHNELSIEQMIEKKPLLFAKAENENLTLF